MRFACIGMALALGLLAAPATWASPSTSLETDLPAKEEAPARQAEVREGPVFLCNTAEQVEEYIDLLKSYQAIDAALVMEERYRRVVCGMMLNTFQQEEYLKTIVFPGRKFQIEVWKVRIFIPMWVIGKDETMLFLHTRVRYGPFW